MGTINEDILDSEFNARHLIRDKLVLVAEGFVELVDVIDDAAELSLQWSNNARM
jgi:hypothetical protein